MPFYDNNRFVKPLLGSCDQYGYRKTTSSVNILDELQDAQNILLSNTQVNRS